MGSKVEPYFILTAEKVKNPRELKELHNKQIDTVVQDNLPKTPPPSGVSGNNGLDLELNTIPKRIKKKGFVKYKIPVKEFKKKDKLNKKMELIKEKLEKSRERFNELKRSQGELDLKCEPNNAVADDSLYANPFKLERSVSDITHTRTSKKTENSSQFVYFVVTEEESEDENGGKFISKSAGKRRRLRIVEENRLKRDKTERQNPSAKKIGLVRELGLKSSFAKGDTHQGSPNKPSVNHIVFQGPEKEIPSKSQRQTNTKVLRTIHSPPRIPPGTPATMLTTHSGEKPETTGMDPDENVPRKPFLSGPLYTGKNRGTHAFSLQHFELPEITPEQKRRALGMSTKFDEFAYPKSQSEQRQRKVSFADQLPVVKGNGFSVNQSDIKETFGLEIPALGPRAHTMGSITLPSERLDKQSVCQRYLAGESMSSAKTLRKFGVPLPLPKIDIVSSVYDEMIIKMIKEYLQDTNTPSRQSQLAKELLVHLQKHNEHMKELNVPNLNTKNRSKLNKEDIIKHQKRAQELLNNINFPVPPNTAEDAGPKVMTPGPKVNDISETSVPDAPEFKETGDNEHDTISENPRNIPFVQITFKPRGDETETKDLPEDISAVDNQTNSKTTTNDKKSPSRPILSAVTPVSFQMAPPGLERDDSFVSVPIKSNFYART